MSPSPEPAPRQRRSLNPFSQPLGPPTTPRSEPVADERAGSISGPVANADPATAPPRKVRPGLRTQAAAAARRVAREVGTEIVQSPARFCILWAVGVLVTMGLVALYSAGIWRGDGYYYRQLHWTLWGLAAAVAAGCLGSQRLRKWHLPCVLYVAVLVLLILVLVPGLGTKVNGARRWLWGMQPSEAAKPVLIIALAAYCAAHLPGMRNWREGFLKPGLLTLPFVVLVFGEPDWGTAILLASIAGIMLAIAGARLSWLFLAGLGAVAVLIPVLLADPVRLGRFIGFLDPERWKDTYAWQPWLEILSFGRGHWLGVGLGNGLLKLGFVPEQHTDAILSLIGEEMGLVGAGAVLAAFVLFFASGLWICWRARDPFAQLVAAGITFLIGLQAFMNIGVALSVLPNKGIALPLVSYGGSSQVTLLACVGLLLGIEARSRREEREEREKAERGGTTRGTSEPDAPAPPPPHAPTSLDQPETAE